ncbi:hypothetical protein CO168_00240 [Candidatus Shapirobacteria bacterium CG_4_9_14_3_um_filter_36_12]|uniref:Uncharacterized protein n=3 Tax=Candidatus Shapironibacteriota TaxID=1752721 RepID=A0A2M7XP49_9BACT|nr:MAG: hypothetical protein CO168_00240 [Candidatus Shapirobacteria bacterium CG_4_9_14_3_um_filter_36_12]
MIKLDMEKPNIAVVFWFYKEPEICINRLKLIKKYNPKIKIFGLFGGNQNEESLYNEKLGGYLDDFYTHPSANSDWKWIHGDLMLLDWYKDRGQKLKWDSVVIVQWDMLVFDSFDHQFPNIKRGEMFMSGLQTLDKYTEENWEWTSPNGEFRADFENFLNYVDKKYNYHNKLLPCCLFVLEIIPRMFFEKYLTVENKGIGMLEYKIPIYAEIFNIKKYLKDMGAHWWGNVEEYPLNAEPTEIKTEYIEKELIKKNGWRIFHPYFKIWEENEK